MSFGGITLPGSDRPLVPIVDVAWDTYVTLPTSGSGSLHSRLFGGVDGGPMLGAAGATNNAVHHGVPCLRLSNTLQNKAALQWGFAIRTDSALSGALSYYNRVYRLRANYALDAVALAPSADVGVKCAWGTNTSAVLKDWRQASGPGPGQSGFGVLFFGAGAISWVQRAIGASAGQFYDGVPLTWPDDETNFVEVEFRVYDAWPGSNARVELWLNAVKILTRYWINPPGVSTPTLALPSVSDGFQLSGPIACTTTDGPAAYAMLGAQVLQTAYDLAHEL